MSNKHSISHEKADKLIEQLYDESSNELPGEDLDTLILNKANEDLKSSKVGVNKLINWQRYSSLAASLVVVFTIGMIYYDNEQLVQPESPIMMKQEAGSMEQVFSDSNLSAGASIAEDETKFLEQEEIAEEMVRAERAVMSVAPQKKAKPVLSKTAEPRAMMAPMQVKETTKAKRKAIAADSDDIVLEMLPEPVIESEILIRDIRAAITQNDKETAKRLYKVLQESYPETEVPEDILVFFSNDF